MKRLLLAAASAAALAACGRIDQIDVTRSGEATVPAGPPGTPITSGVVPLSVAIGREALAQQGIRPEDVDSARLRALRIEVLSGSSLEGWVDALAFHVQAAGLPRVLVARRSGIRALPADTRSVDLETTGVDLKPYLLAPTATITAEGTGTLPAAETRIRATATLRVDVNVTGLLGG